MLVRSEMQGTGNEMFYVSGTFWLTVVLVVMTIGLLGLGYQTVQVARQRRVLHWEQSVVPMLRPDRRLEGRLAVTWDDHELPTPTLVTVRLLNRGRLDIGSSAYDGGRPISFSFAARAIVALLEPQPLTSPDALPVRMANGAVEVGPGLLKTGDEVTIVVLTDSSLGCRADFPLENVKVIRAGVGRRSGRVWFLQLATLTTILAGVVTATLQVVYRPDTPVITEFAGGCEPFTVYSQNAWEPAGAAVRAAPLRSAVAIGTFGPNESIQVDGWVDTQAAYPSNSPPFNNSIWFHVADDSGWVTYAGVRADLTEPDTTGQAPETDARVLLDPECAGSLD